MNCVLVTLNVGLLSLCGGRIQPAPFVDHRLLALPDQLRRLGASVVALQEIYSEKHRKFLIAQLADLYPHVAYVRERPIWGLESGLMVLSTEELDFRFERFRFGPFEERLFDRKGVLICRIGKSDSRWSLLNAHTTAGGIWLHPESERANLFRRTQISQILQLADAERGVAVIAGDMNTGPGVSEDNFRQLLMAGFISAHDRTHESDASPTWDPANPLNQNGPHRTSPPQRIDHVLVKKVDLESRTLSLLSSDICCQDRVAATPCGPVTVSDHYGLRVEFLLEDTAPLQTN